MSARLPFEVVITYEPTSFGFPWVARRPGGGKADIEAMAMTRLGLRFALWKLARQYAKADQLSAKYQGGAR